MIPNDTSQSPGPNYTSLCLLDLRREEPWAAMIIPVPEIYEYMFYENMMVEKTGSQWEWSVETKTTSLLSR